MKNQAAHAWMVLSFSQQLMKRGSTGGDGRRIENLSLKKHTRILRHTATVSSAPLLWPLASNPSPYEQNPSLTLSLLPRLLHVRPSLEASSGGVHDDECARKGAWVSLRARLCVTSVRVCTWGCVCVWVCMCVCDRPAAPSVSIVVNWEKPHCFKRKKKLQSFCFWKIEFSFYVIVQHKQDTMVHKLGLGEGTWGRKGVQNYHWDWKSFWLWGGCGEGTEGRLWRQEEEEQSPTPKDKENDKWENLLSSKAEHLPQNYRQPHHHHSTTTLRTVLVHHR